MTSDAVKALLVVIAIVFVAVLLFPLLFWHNIYVTYMVLRHGLYEETLKHKIKYDKVNRKKNKHVSVGFGKPASVFDYLKSACSVAIAFLIFIVVRGFAFLCRADLPSMRYIVSHAKIRRRIVSRFNKAHQWRFVSSTFGFSPNMVSSTEWQASYDNVMPLGHAIHVDQMFFDKKNLVYVQFRYKRDY